MRAYHRSIQWRKQCRRAACRASPAEPGGRSVGMCRQPCCTAQHGCAPAQPGLKRYQRSWFNWGSRVSSQASSASLLTTAFAARSPSARGSADSEHLRAMCAWAHDCGNGGRTLCGYPTQSTHHPPCICIVCVAQRAMGAQLFYNGCGYPTPKHPSSLCVAHLHIPSPQWRHRATQELQAGPAPLAGNSKQMLQDIV